MNEEDKKNMYAGILATIVKENGGEMLFHISDEIINSEFSIFYRFETRDEGNTYIRLKLGMNENLQ